MKNERGEITIQMVVIGIILIVLVGVCIFMLTGENGLFVLKTQNNEPKNEIITNQTINSDEQNVTNNENKNDNENGALVVPVE